MTKNGYIAIEVVWAILNDNAVEISGMIDSLFVFRNCDVCYL